jgi:hypothetical protein
MSRKSGALTYPEPLGPPWPVVGDLYIFIYRNYFALFNELYTPGPKALFNL